MKDLTSWVGVVVFVFGLYCFFAAYQMKAKGIINNSILLGKEYLYKTCKDKDAYIKKMFPHVLLFACATTFCGAADIVNSFVTDITVVYDVSLLLFVFDFIWFTKESRDAKRKYY